MSASSISIGSLVSGGTAGLLLRACGPVIDRVLGLSELSELYELHSLGRMDPSATMGKFLEVRNVQVLGGEDLVAQVPASGPSVVVCNHPFGCVEGIALATVLGRHRRDLKILANPRLRVFQNLADLFVFADPMRPSDPRNVSALRACARHLKRGGLLVLFPAGRVATLDPADGRIADAPWNRVAARLALHHNATVVNAFVQGTNSAMFHRLGRVHPRLRMALLLRELLRFRDRTLVVRTAPASPARTLMHTGDVRAATAILRVRTYLQDPTYALDWPSSEAKAAAMSPLAPPGDSARVGREVAALPPSQQLVEFKNFSVYYARQTQAPETVHEIARLREKTFRLLDEGSGTPVDADRFDATYVHLFAFDRANNEVIGAYRLGASDELLAGGDLSQLYLSAMFEFGPSFPNRTSSALELGRSFLVREHQRSAHGLYLLWRGIGAFVAQHPRYRTLYGTVSLSKTYLPRSVDLIGRALVRPGADVVAHTPFAIPPHPEVVDFFHAYMPTMPVLSQLVRSIEADGKDVPVLVKQYAKLGAQFHCIGIDHNFNSTPGMLLSIDLPKAPSALLARYLGEQASGYLSYAPARQDYA